MDETLGDFAAADILVEEGAILAVGRSLDAAGAETVDAAGMIEIEMSQHDVTHIRPVARRLLLEVPAAARPLHGRGQFQRRLDRRLGDAVVRHHDGRRLLP